MKTIHPVEYRWCNVVLETPTLMRCKRGVTKSGFNNGEVYEVYGISRVYVYLWNDCGNYVRAPRKWFDKENLNEL